jgi:hypothetical protein
MKRAGLKRIRRRLPVIWLFNFRGKPLRRVTFAKIPGE